MSEIDLGSHLDAEHLAALEAIPPNLLDLTDIGRARARLLDAFAEMEQPIPTDVEIHECDATGHEGHSVRVRIYRPARSGTHGPVMLWFHGGGMVMGSAAMDDAVCAERASTHGAVIVSVDYRLAPEDPYPAQLDDGMAALEWIASNPDLLGTDPGRIVVGGNSAGGCLAAGIAIMSRDLAGPPISYQYLESPMLDHRMSTTSSRMIASDNRVWNSAANQIAWDAYLGDSDREALSPWASPGTAKDLSGLPPPYISVGSLDIFVDEIDDYARTLRGSGVPTELHIYPGGFHGSIAFAPDSSLSRRWRQDNHEILRQQFS